LHNGIICAISSFFVAKKNWKIETYVRAKECEKKENVAQKEIAQHFVCKSTQLTYGE